MEYAISRHMTGRNPVLPVQKLMLSQQEVFIRGRGKHQDETLSMSGRKRFKGNASAGGGVLGEGGGAGRACMTRLATERTPGAASSSRECCSVNHRTAPAAPPGAFLFYIKKMNYFN